MSHQDQTLWHTLVEAGAVEGDHPLTRDIESPWYVKALIAFSGWLAACSLLLFLAFGMDIFDSPSASFIVGSIMIIGAYATLRATEHDFLEHAALAISLAGQALFITAAFDYQYPNETSVWLMVLLMQSLLAVFMPHFIHRALSSIYAAFALLALMTLWGVGVFFEGVVAGIAAFLWLNEFRFPKHIKTLQAIGYGVLLSAACLSSSVDLSDIFLRSESIELPWLKNWMGALLISSVMIALVLQLLQRNHCTINSKTGWLALIGTAVICIASMEIWGLSTGLMIILLGFAASNRVIQGIGIVALLYNASSYYYTLDITLLEKSQHLLILGILLILARWIMHKVLTPSQEIDHV